MKIRLVSLLSFATLTWAFSLPQPKKPSELVVLRDEGLRCTVLSFRETQILRGVTGDAVYTTSLATVEGRQRVSYVSYDVSAIWNKAHLECANDLTEGLWVEGVEDVQHTFHTSTSIRGGVPPPELKVSPLVVSGPSSNRVDLVFFSDGCEYLKYTLALYCRFDLS